MNSAISLHEYRIACPGSARIPTVTQQGLIGPILLRHHRKAVRRARRRAARERILAGVANAFAWIWRKLTASAKPASAHRGHDLRNLKPSAAYVDR
jgi:hypothetical protein